MTELGNSLSQSILVKTDISHLRCRCD